MAVSKQVEFLEELQLQYPNLAAHFAKFAELYTAKLWHQLTLLLEEAIALPEFQDGDLLIRLYDGFVSEIAQRINLLKLAHIVTAVAKRYTDLQQACGFIETVSRSWHPPSPSAAFPFVAILAALHFHIQILVLRKREGQR